MLSQPLHDFQFASMSSISAIEFSADFNRFKTLRVNAVTAETRNRNNLKLTLSTEFQSLNLENIELTSDQRS